MPISLAMYFSYIRGMKVLSRKTGNAIFLAIAIVICLAIAVMMGTLIIGGALAEKPH